MNPIQKITRTRLLQLVPKTRKARMLGAGAVFLSMCAFGAVAVAPIANDPSDLPVQSVAQDLELPNLADQIAALQQNEQQFIHEERIRRGDSLGSIFTRLGIEDAQAQKFVRSDKVARRLLSLPNGKRIQAETDENGMLLSMSATVVDGKSGNARTITVERKGEKFVALDQPAKLERRVEMRSREIASSLYAATDDANMDGGTIPDSVVGEIIEMFSTSIDFRSDVKRGDRFNVVYETFWLDGELVKTGRILAGEFVNRGTSYQSVWYEDPISKQGGYYSLDGKALKKAFLKSPLQYSRISSGFSMRTHPISGKWKAHKGVDYAAVTGTPIRAVADATVDFAGNGNGYGNMVVLKHWSNYSSAYAHMSRIAPGMKKGSKISQGQVIGYVGSTGWSTGAHLHYEFRVAGVAQDPNKFKSLVQQPLSQSELARFRMAAAEMNHRFSLLAPSGNGMAAR